jgi:hypothetical protein
MKNVQRGGRRKNEAEAALRNNGHDGNLLGGQNDPAPVLCDRSTEHKAGISSGARC